MLEIKTDNSRPLPTVAVHLADRIVTAFGAVVKDKGEGAPVTATSATIAWPSMLVTGHVRGSDIERLSKILRALEDSNE